MLTRLAVAVSFAALAALAACGPTNVSGSEDGGGPHADAGPAVDGAVGPDAMLTCDPAATDQAGCTCDPAAPPRACYPNSAPAATRGVGQCKDGTQACVASGEFPAYGPCTGATVPTAENCSNGLDDSCANGSDCADPTCALDPACQTGCSDGETRPCYDGPADTLDVGACHAGTQTCAGGAWPANCPGEQLPQSEDCATLADLNCNHLPSCFDIFACIGSPACTTTCQITDPSCVCPVGAGDVATCPEGTHGVTNGVFPGTVECCPCSASDCGDPGCCAEAVCAGAAACGGLTCNTLPPSCNGQVNFDCDDFPEDCDEPCCKCTDCP